MAIDNRPHLKVYDVQTANPTEVTKTLSALMPGVVVNEDDKARRIHILATPDEHREVEQLIRQIDGQGGGIGATLIKYLKEAYGESVVLIALGTNAIATAQMLKAGANKGASGENAICRTVFQVECIVGPIAVTWANAMLGEVTPKMAEAVTSSPAIKILLPLSQESVKIVGADKEPLPHLVQEAVEKIKEVMKHV